MSDVVTDTPSYPLFMEVLGSEDESLQIRMATFIYHASKLRREQTIGAF